MPRSFQGSNPRARSFLEKPISTNSLTGLRRTTLTTDRREIPGIRGAFRAAPAEAPQLESPLVFVSPQSARTPVAQFVFLPRFAESWASSRRTIVYPRMESFRSH